ncbi:endonuclease/exonuclease/phosphatase family protein [Parabacteroides sp. OttesenSCG-928-K15]|nr:endonuclease/exonuclease/phosphatase family protein [Parabacteroides sp. OttesenSCG-928-K15]
MKNTTYLLFVCVLCLFSLQACSEARTEQTLKVLQINIWQEGTSVPEGFGGIVDIIDQLEPDVVLLCEIRNYKEEAFVPKLVEALAAKGQIYNGESLDMSVGILSRYAIQNATSAFTLANNSRPLLKATMEINGQNIVFYSAHLDYTHYECYLPRGYSGTTWQKIEAPVVDPIAILEANRIAWRDEAIEAFVAEAGQEIEKGHIVILGGDFNEPSHLDWQADTKDMWDHNGVVIRWDCSVILHNAGYRDAFREKYPDAAQYPGFTFPSANKDVSIDKLAWAPEADERDRIDFIYYHPHPAVTLTDIHVVGPSETILRGKQIGNDSSDTFIEPRGVWPTDHKATFAEFKIRK